MKNTFYFSHDFNASNDIKIIEMELEHGYYGYAVFFKLLEFFGNTKDYKLKLKSIKSIAKRLNGDPEIFESVIKDFGLFEYDDEYFWSASFLDRMNKRKEITEAKSRAGKKGMKSRYGNSQEEQNPNTVITENKSVITKNNSVITEPNKERKGKERKEKENKSKEKEERIDKKEMATAENENSDSDPVLVTEISSSSPLLSKPFFDFKTKGNKIIRIDDALVEEFEKKYPLIDVKMKLCDYQDYLELNEQRRPRPEHLIRKIEEKFEAWNQEAKEKTEEKAQKLNGNQEQKWENERSPYYQFRHNIK